MSTVRTAQRTVVEMVAPDNVTGMPDSAAAAAVRRGTDEEAGLACTDWDMTDAAGEAARLCLSEDGVLLRARAGGRTLSAETVVTGPLDVDLFQVPVGYTHRVMGPQPARAHPGSPQPASPKSAIPQSASPQPGSPK